MPSEQNVQKVRELFDAFYAADDKAMNELIGDDFVTHAPGGSTGNAASVSSPHPASVEFLTDRYPPFALRP